MPFWDAKVHTHNPNRSAILIVEGKDDDEARRTVREVIKRQWPDETIRELVIEPTVTTRAQRRKMKTL